MKAKYLCRLASETATRLHGKTRFFCLLMQIQQNQREQKRSNISALLVLKHIKVFDF